jgi:hypothetical protein
MEGQREKIAGLPVQARVILLKFRQAIRNRVLVLNESFVVALRLPSGLEFFDCWEGPPECRESLGGE